MRSSLLALGALCIAWLDLAAQTPTWLEFARHGNNGGTLIGNAVITRPAGYWLAGEETSVGSGRDAVLMITPGLIDTAAMHSFSGPGTDRATDLIATTDGGALMIGSTDSYPVTGLSAANAFVVKLDMDGNAEWSAQYGGMGIDEVRRVILTADGGYLLAGRTNSFGNGSFDAWLLHLDAAGEVQWSMAYGSTDDDEANDVVELADGGHVLLGTTAGTPFPGTAVLLVKVNASGGLNWSRTCDLEQPTYWNVRDRRGSEILLQDANTLVISGTVGGYDSGASVASDAFLMRLDTSGTVMHSCKSFHFNSGHTYVHRMAPAGTYYAMAMERGLQNAGIARWTQSGTLGWNRYITLVPPYGADRTFGIAITNEGNFVTCGYQVFGADTALLVAHGRFASDLCFQGSDEQVNSTTGRDMEMTVASLVATSGGTGAAITFSIADEELHLNEHCTNTAVSEQARRSIPVLSPTATNGLGLLRLEHCSGCADVIDLLDLQGASIATGTVRSDGSIQWHRAADPANGVYAVRWRKGADTVGTARVLIVH